MFQETESSVIIYYLIGTLLLLLFITAIVTYAFLHQKKVIQLRTRLHEEDMRRQREVFNALQEGEEKERSRLAEELHDGISAKLSGLKMSLEYLDANTTENKELVHKIFYGLAETLEEVRLISHNLQTFFFADKDMEQMLTAFTEQLSARNGCRYDLLIEGDTNTIDKAIKLQCYRIITELLNNIHKHAKASLASVQIIIENEKMDIVIEDNGIGFDTTNPNGGGMGMMNVRKRAEVCGGSISFDSSGKGTTVIVEIPLNLIQ